MDLMSDEIGVFGLLVAEAAETPKECGTCTLRHQRLGKSQEARERERAELRELFENSEPNTQ